jgi:hypothetical protein
MSAAARRTRGKVGRVIRDFRGGSSLYGRDRDSVEALQQAIGACAERLIL